jgi:hypothetical protein
LRVVLAAACALGDASASTVVRHPLAIVQPPITGTLTGGDGFGGIVSGDETNVRIAITANYDYRAGGERGSIYLYRLEDGEWVKEARLTANPTPAGSFGRALVDGDTVVSIDQQVDRALIFRRDTTTGFWDVSQELDPNYGGSGRIQFGDSVDLRGNVLAIAAPGYFPSGAVYLYKDSGTWSPDGLIQLDAVPSWIGLGSQNLAVQVGSNSVKFYSTADHSAPAELLTLPPDYYVLVMRDSTLVAYAYNQQTLSFYEHVGGSWQAVAIIQSIDGRPISNIAPAADRNSVLVTTDAGYFLYQRFGGTVPPWQQSLAIPYSPRSISSLSTFTYVAGHLLEGFANAAITTGRAATGVVQSRSPASPDIVDYIDPGYSFEGARFGAAIGVDSGRLIVGAPGPNPLNASGNGVAYVYAWSGQTFSPDATLTQLPGAQSDAFASSVAISGDRLIVGAPRSWGSNGGPNGEAQVFMHSNGGWQLEKRFLSTDLNGYDYQLGASVAMGDSLAVVLSPYALTSPTRYGCEEHDYQRLTIWSDYPWSGITCPGGTPSPFNLKGAYLAIGAKTTLSVQVAAGGVWTQIASTNVYPPLTSLAYDDGYVVTASSGSYKVSGSTLTPISVDTPSVRAGMGVTLGAAGANGGYAVFSGRMTTGSLSSDVNAVWVYQRVGDAYHEIARIEVPNSLFGADLGYSTDIIANIGATVFVGQQNFAEDVNDPSSGAVLVYQADDPIFESGFDWPN